MRRREPSDAALLAARIMRAFPTELSAYSAASLAESLCSIERAQRRHAERCCNGDYDRSSNPRHVAQNIENGIAERRASEKIDRHVVRWLGMLHSFVGQSQTIISLENDPRGPVLLLQLPGETEAVVV